MIQINILGCLLCEFDLLDFDLVSVIYIQLRILSPTSILCLTGIMSIKVYLILYP